MRVAIVFPALALLVPALAYHHGDIPVNVAVRSDGDGVHHFYDKDRVAHEKREMMKRQEVADTDPILDKYPVKTDGEGKVVAFAGTR